MTVVARRNLRLSCTLDFHENCPSDTNWRCDCTCHTKVVERNFGDQHFKSNLDELIYETWRTVRMSGGTDQYYSNLFSTIEKLYERSSKPRTNIVALLEVIIWISERSDYSTNVNELRLKEIGVL